MNRRDLLIAVGVWSAGSLSAQRIGSVAAERIHAAIRECYRVWETGDAKRYSALLTADYMLLEHVVPMNMDEDLKNGPPPPGSTRTDAFTFQATEIAGKVAYTYYFLDSVTVSPKETTLSRYLESAVLRRAKGSRWKVALVHSTHVENKKAD